MALFNGKGGVIAKASAVVGLITAILLLNWNVTDRVHKAVDDAKADAIEVAKAGDEKLETEITASLSKFQRQQDTRYWIGLRDQAKIELDRIRRGLAHHPNDPNLLSDRAYWQEVYNRAVRELDKIINP